jgi:hypothetical protein
MGRTEHPSPSLSSRPSVDRATVRGKETRRSLVAGHRVGESGEESASDLVAAVDRDDGDRSAVPVAIEQGIGNGLEVVDEREVELGVAKYGAASMTRQRRRRSLSV